MWPRKAGSPIKLRFRNLNSILSEPPAGTSVQRCRADLALEYPIANSCIDRHQRVNPQVHTAKVTLAPETEGATAEVAYARIFWMRH